MNWLVKNFLRGLIIVVPIGVSIWVVYRAFTTLDQLLSFRWPGVGIVVIVAATILLGALASNYVVGKLLELTQAIFTRAPLVRLVYASIRDLLEAFVGEKKGFDRPVAVALSDSVTSLGFVTQRDLSFLGMSDKVAVYFPFSYSMAGILLVVPSARVIPLDNDSASVMALIVSGGVSRV